MVSPTSSSAKRDGGIVTVRAIRDGVITTEDGRSIDTRRVRELSYGYAVTSHKSQSKTVDHVVVAAERLDAKSAYVACSRGRLSCSVHTPDKAHLLDRLPERLRPFPNRLWRLEFPSMSGDNSTESAMAAFHRLFGVDNPLKLPNDKDAMRAASERARAAFFAKVDQFRKGLEPNERLIVKAPFKVPEGNEYMWMEVDGRTTRSKVFFKTTRHTTISPSLP